MSTFEIITNPEEMAETIKKLSEQLKEVQEQVSSITKEMHEIREYKDDENVKEHLKLLETSSQTDWVKHFNSIPPHLLKKVHDLYQKDDDMYFQNLAAYYFYKCGFKDMVNRNEFNLEGIIDYAYKCDDYDTIKKFIADYIIDMNLCKVFLKRAMNDNKHDEYLKVWIDLLRTKL